MSARPSPTVKGTVLFVHGLWMTGVESFPLKRLLAPHGWRLNVLPYSSLTESLDSVARRCARHAQALARRTLLPVHLLGHSLGGFVIYRAFELGLFATGRFGAGDCRVVFLGVPVRGSQSARVLAGLGPVRNLLGEMGRPVLPQGVAQRWSFAAQLGVISGTLPVGLGRLLRPFDGPNDGTVAVAETRLEGATDHCELPVTHTGLCLSRQVAANVADFLDAGRFSRR